MAASGFARLPPPPLGVRPTACAAGPRLSSYNVLQNGQIVKENIEVTGPTRSAMFERDPEKPTGPLMLQGDHGPVAYRNITVTPL